MATIERIEKFVTDGKEFSSLQKAIDYREGLVDAFIRKLAGFWIIPANDRIAFIQAILDNRDKVRALLDFSSVNVHKE